MPRVMEDVNVITSYMTSEVVKLCYKSKSPVTVIWLMSKRVRGESREELKGLNSQVQLSTGIMIILALDDKMVKKNK